jgi:hypothetical protein
MYWSARACGSWAATAGRTISVTAAWTTSWLRAQCQSPGARHRSLLQHRRAGFQVHPAGGGCQVCRPGQGPAQERPGHDRHGLRLCLCRRIAMGASDQQTLNAFLEADAYDGPSLIIAYSHCIAHGIDMRKGLEQQKLAVNSGIWPLYRFNPALAPRARTRCPSTRKSRLSRSSSTCTTRLATACCCKATSSAPRCCWPA